jgi:hypothetical protein
VARHRRVLMIVCQWHLDIPHGKQAEALAVLAARAG